MHEEKSCLRCSHSFECKAATIAEYQCYGVILSTEEKVFIEERYNECLCRICLLELKDRYIFLERNFYLTENKEAVTTALFDAVFPGSLSSNFWLLI